MRVWLITVGEPLDLDGHSVRLLRTGILANILVEQGHEVVWWTSTFAHHKKKHRFLRDAFLETGPRFRTILLHSRAYRRNISLARIMNHRGIARKFSRYAVSETPPDLILSSWPTIELSTAAIRYGQRAGIPVLLDVRDLWPDIFLDAVPPHLRWLGDLALRPLKSQTRFAMERADGILAMSNECLRWGLRQARRDPGPRDAVYPLGYHRPSVDADQMSAAASALRRKGVDEGKLICWFLGTFGKVYDVGTVIEGARELARRGVQNVQFVLSGDGDRRSLWASQAHGLQNVVFTGWIDPDEIAYMMKIADIGLVAYDAGPEFLPNKLFEYFSAGLPVLSSLRGDEGKSLLARHECGLTYAPKDSAGFVDALSILVGDEPRRHRMGANARRLFETDYDARTVYSRMADFLVDLCRAPSRSQLLGVPPARDLKSPPAYRA